MPDFSAPIPILRSFNEAAACAFYLDFLAFELVFKHRFDSSSLLYLSLLRGLYELHISEHHGDGTPGGAVRTQIDDIHSFCAHLNARDYPQTRVVVQLQPWGTSEMIIVDPAGNRQVFWSPDD